jgi:hypothetical protein
MILYPAAAATAANHTYMAGGAAECQTCATYIGDPPHERLEEKNRHARDVAVTFRAGACVYSVPGGTAAAAIASGDTDQQTRSSSVPYISITQTKSMLFRAIELDLDKAIDRMQSDLATWYTSGYFGMSREQIKESWTKAREMSRQGGMYLHAQIEKFFNGSPYDCTSRDMHHFLNFYVFLRVSLPDFVPYRTEWKIYHEDCRLVGTVDFVGKICGPPMHDGTDSATFWLVDWKRANAIQKENSVAGCSKSTRAVPDANYWHYAVQLSLYAMILLECYGIDACANLWVVNLHPTQQTYQLHKMPYMKDAVADIQGQRREAIIAGAAPYRTVHGAVRERGGDAPSPLDRRGVA